MNRRFPVASALHIFFAAAFGMPDLFFIIANSPPPKQ